MIESGVKGVDVSQWYCLMAPAGVSKALIGRIDTEVMAVLRLPHTRERFAGAGLEPSLLRSSDLLALWRGDTARWASVIKEAGIQLTQ